MDPKMEAVHNFTNEVVVDQKYEKLKFKISTILKVESFTFDIINNY